MAYCKENGKHGILKENERKVFENIHTHIRTQKEKEILSMYLRNIKRN